MTVPLVRQAAMPEQVHSLNSSKTQAAEGKVDTEMSSRGKAAHSSSLLKVNQPSELPTQNVSVNAFQVVNSSAIEPNSTLDFKLSCPNLVTANFQGNGSALSVINGSCLSLSSTHENNTQQQIRNSQLAQVNQAAQEQ